MFTEFNKTARENPVSFCVHYELSAVAEKSARRNIKSKACDAVFLFHIGHHAFALVNLFDYTTRKLGWHVNNELLVWFKFDTVLLLIITWGFDNPRLKPFAGHWSRR